MADISKIVTPNGDEYNLKDALKKGVYTVIGTQTAQTAAWTGNIDVPALYDGLTIAYYLPYRSEENVSLNLTLSNGTKTGAVACYIGTSRISTHYSVGSTIILTYYGAGSVSVGGTPISAARWSAGDFNSNSWRNIQVNGTELLRTATSSGALNLKSGTNVTVSGSGNDVTISATDTVFSLKGGSITTTTNAELWAGDGIDIQSYGMMSSVGYQISSTDYYHKGDSFSIEKATFPIYLGASYAYFIIPLMKNISSDVTTISVNGKWRAIITNSNTAVNSVWINNDVLTSKGTVGAVRTAMGIRVAVSGTNLVPNWSLGVINAFSGNTITFS